jgi:hypothetical protein
MTGLGNRDSTPGRAPGPRRVNTHVHLPPNFSAFTTVEDVVESAAREGVRVLGASNFYDLGIYARFGAAAEQAGVVPLFGIELITVMDAAQRDGTLVNDPANPGRAYLCGKGIAGFASPGAEARRRLDAVRTVDEDRMRRMVGRLRDWFAAAGLDTSLTDDAIAADVAERADAPRDWVVLQERHVAMAFQEALFLQHAPGRRRGVLERAFGRAPDADVEDAVAVQGDIRSQLMRSGRPAFEPESPVPFEDGMRLVLELGGIPCYPTLADGASPVCRWEEPPRALAERLLDRGVHAAELIPVRNRPAVVDAYVAAFREAGIVVMAGTEHNTQERISLEPRCRGGSLPSPAAREAFWEGTCVAAAHQHLRATGRPGFVDGEGRANPGFPDAEARIRWFRELGADVIAGRLPAGVR